MAVLPDAERIGVNVGGGGRPMASVDTTGYARGAEARARGVAAAAEATGRGETALAQGNLRYAESVERGGQAAAKAAEAGANIRYEGEQALAKAGLVEAAATASTGQAFASGVQELGKAGFGLGRDIGVIAYRDDLIDYERAKSQAAVGRIGLEANAQKDNEWRTLETRHDEALRGIQEAAIASVPNARLRDKLRIDLADDYARSVAGVGSLVKKRSDDNDVAELNGKLTTYKEAAAKTGVQAEKDEYLRLAQLAITAAHAKGAITAEEEQKKRQAFVEDYGKSWVMNLPAQERQRLIREGGSFDTALRDRESGDNPSRVNQLGYAGYYQFGAPRLETLGIYKPGAGENMQGWSKTAGNAAGKWSGTFNIPGFPDVQTLRDFLRNPQAQEAAYSLHKQRMDKEIVDNGLSQYIGKVVGGVPITRDGLYGMIHLGGVGGAQRALSSGGTDVVRDANGTSVLDYARMGAKTGGKTGTPLDFVPSNALYTIRQHTEKEVASEQATLSAVAVQQFDRQMIDAAAGVGVLPDRKAIETNPYLSEPQRNSLLAKHTNAAGDVVAFQAVLAKFKDPAQGPFNPYDSNEVKAVDTLYNQMGATLPNLQAVVDRTGILPKTAASRMQSDIISNDPKRVAGTLSVASDLLARNQNVFSAVKAGGSNIEEQAIAYRSYVEDRGLTAEEAGQKIVRSQSPEYQAAVKAKIKSEDIDAKLKKEVGIGDIESAFDASWAGLARNPSVGFDPGQRQKMFAQYSELVKENYLENGDMTLSKALAANTFKKTWGVSNVNGSAGWSGGGVVMQYPPERSPAMAGVENASELIAKSAIADIQAELGRVAKPNGLIEAGNIDLNSRPVVKQKDGSIATVKSTSVNFDGREVLIPTISDDGRALTTDQAIDQYRATGKHLGIFSTPDAATAYAKDLSAAQGRQYGADIQRKDIRLSPIPGVTAQAFKEGKPAPYLLEWTDKNGIVHMLNPGKAWVADPVAMRSAQTGARQAGFEREVKIADFKAVEDSVRMPGLP
jgi:hypothetical protein